MGAASCYEAMTLTEKILRLLDERHVSQAGLARETGLAPQMISDFLAGRRKQLYLHQALAIARALGCSVDYLADDTKDADPHARSSDERAILGVFRASGLSLEEAAGRLTRRAPAEPLVAREIDMTVAREIEPPAARPRRKAGG